MENFIDSLSEFVFWYPLIMSVLWIAGSSLFFKFREKEEFIDFENIDWPLISILVPCYNEEETIEETIQHLSGISYPKKEIIAVNDGSTDDTFKILRRLAKQHQDLKIIDCQENRGKANALIIACHASKAEYLICVDSDALLDQYAAHYLIYHFLHKGERLGAVTGNPRIRNRDTLLSRLQIVEYASIIGAIKRTQRILGKIMTVSGVVVAFRKKALIDVGLWDRDMITEDISVSWKLQQRFWDIRYEPRALCWMLVPETIRGIWKQRIRWAQGGQEVMMRNWRILLDSRQRRIWPVYLEQWVSLIWSFSWVFVTLFYLFSATTIQQFFIWITFSSFSLVFMSLIQLWSSIRVDSKYDNITKYYLWAAWYPAIYWILNAFIVMFALPKAIKSRLKGGYATWSSPDRGNRKVS
ncbi:poly-beta-1,6-N-acetyl-D-glucosamine synthase [Metabacillus elymi]|uniref:Poly-beta-1,6-N-acetyl-D-glucosamine synthase n=1 Tax=Metabacillus elymi TaxID=2745198 RepID=A0ABX6S8J3_9BACI|nr:poly-beta-1,6-N-acetyl-D-glucosamine synthase [Metabacillus sp. KUDC1714]QNF29942.1 poly-beta-1,6 N-acetyl-D-glucosamine synthase [Metabacillus sp. KUDC1714]